MMNVMNISEDIHRICEFIEQLDTVLYLNNSILQKISELKYLLLRKLLRLSTELENMVGEKLNSLMSKHPSSSVVDNFSEEKSIRDEEILNCLRAINGHHDRSNNAQNNQQSTEKSDKCCSEIPTNIYSVGGFNLI